MQNQLYENVIIYAALVISLNNFRNRIRCFEPPIIGLEIDSHFPGPLGCSSGIRPPPPDL